MKNVKKLEAIIHRVETNIINYTRKLANKKWFDEECSIVNKKKNAARERAIQINFKLARTKERHLFRKKERQIDEEALIVIE
jgi:hypothetical protein